MRELQRAVGNAAMGRLVQSPPGRAVLRRAASAGSHRSRVLARDFEVSPLVPRSYGGAERELGPNDRPPSTRFFAEYAKVSYDVWKKGQNPPGMDEWKQANAPWAFIGGTIGKLFGAKDPDNPKPDEPQHTCAARVSWALNHTSVGTRIKSGKIFYNDPRDTYAGTPGDGMYYIVGAPGMQEYLTKQWGPPDVKLSKIDVYRTDAAGSYVRDPTTGHLIKDTIGDASELRAKLGPQKVAIFAGAHHTGVISQQLKTDDYIYYDAGVMPAVAWILP